MTNSKTAVDQDLRMRVFQDAIFNENDEIIWHKINDRQYGCILTDLNGVERYVRIGAIVAEQREDMTAAELMQSEIDKYNTAQAEKARKAAERKAKAEKDAAKRAEKAE